MTRKTPTLLACVLASCLGLGMLLGVCGCSQNAATSCSLTQWETDASPPVGVTIGTTSVDFLAQTFYLPTSTTPPGTVTLASLDLRLSKVGTTFSTNAGANTVTLSLQEDVSKGIISTAATPDPSGASVAGSSVTVDLLTMSAGESLVHFAFASPVTITQNTSYWILVTANYQAGPGGANYVQWMDYNGTDIYSQGTAYQHSTTNPANQFTSLGTQVYFEFSVNSC